MRDLVLVRRDQRRIVIDMSQNVAGGLPKGGTPPMRSISSKMVYAALPDPKR